MDAQVQRAMHMLEPEMARMYHSIVAKKVRTVFERVNEGDYEAMLTLARCSPIGSTAIRPWAGSVTPSRR